MRRTIIVALALVLMGGAYAELQNVTVGGEIVFRGRIYHDVFAQPGNTVRIPNFMLPLRPIGTHWVPCPPFRGMTRPTA